VRQVQQVRSRQSGWANEVLGRIAFSHADTKLDLVMTTVSALGLGERGASLRDIFARASQLGLALCPAEVVPALRLAYFDQPLGEYLHIAMEPVAIPLNMGKVLGGGSSINVMVWARGHRNDWDFFAAEARDPAWSYESVLNIYRRIGMARRSQSRDGRTGFCSVRVGSEPGCPCPWSKERAPLAFRPFKARTG
jgi:choline dehydrogenase-like flavoprotein